MDDKRQRHEEETPISSGEVLAEDASAHAAISSAPYSRLHFSLVSHISLAFGRSNFLARRKRSNVVSSYRS